MCEFEWRAHTITNRVCAAPRSSVLRPTELRFNAATSAIQWHFGKLDLQGR